MASDVMKWGGEEDKENVLYMYICNGSELSLHIQSIYIYELAAGGKNQIQDSTDLEQWEENVM